MKLTVAEKGVLVALAGGWTLKSHRYLDGTKVYRLHPLGGGEAEPVAWETVDALRAQELVDSNKKFPAATYLLTDRGKRVVAEITALPGENQPDESAPDGNPLGASGWR